MMKRIELDEFEGVLDSLRKPYQDGYLAMYSSVYGGVVTDPVLMLVPIDDHVVHRGDGIFETFKCVDGKIYNMGAHVDRLEHSARILHHRLPVSREEMESLVVETVRVAGQRDVSVRLMLSRGPGGFGVNPYECPEPQLYIIVSVLKAPFMELHPEGARVQTSAVPLKPGFLAEVKSCNYIYNMLMKKEAVDAGVDFAVGFDTCGNMGEGATENFGIVTAAHELQFPRIDGILRGTTMIRVMELAEVLVERGVLSGVTLTDIRREAILAAAEFLVVGTTPNVAAVCEYDGNPVGEGEPGRVSEQLNTLLADDIRDNEGLQTPVF